jgi:hypothetical protein
MAKKIIVLTMYGKDETIDHVSISLFDGPPPGYFSSEKMSNAINYCKNINALKLEGGHWIHAQIVGENEKIVPQKPLQLNIFLKMDSRSIQKILRDVDKRDLARALITTEENIKEKIFENMTKRARAMLQEEMETLQGISPNEIISSRDKIIDTILHLNSTGEIVVKRY